MSYGRDCRVEGLYFACTEPSGTRLRRGWGTCARPFHDTRSMVSRRRMSGSLGHIRKSLGDGVVAPQKVLRTNDRTSGATKKLRPSNTAFGPALRRLDYARSIFVLE